MATGMSIIAPDHSRPGRVAGEPLNVTLDAAGDRAMTERFVADALGARHPALAVLWLGEPDHIQHNAPLGSPEHLAVLREADRNAGMVIDAVDRRRAAGRRHPADRRFRPWT